jgi:hypothetical protein
VIAAMSLARLRILCTLDTMLNTFYFFSFIPALSYTSTFPRTKLSCRAFCCFDIKSKLICKRYLMMVLCHFHFTQASR